MCSLLHELAVLAAVLPLGAALTPDWRETRGVCLTLASAAVRQERVSAIEIQEMIAGARFADAERSARARLAALEAGADETLETAELLELLASALGHQLEAPEEQRDLLLRAIAIREGASEADASPLVFSLSLLASAYEGLGNFTSGLAAADRAVSIGVRSLPADHPAVLRARRLLGVLYYRSGAYQTAEPILRDVLAAQERTEGPESLELARTLQSLGLLLSTLRQYAEAQSVAARALAILERTPHVLLASHPANLLALLAMETGDYAASSARHAQALEYRTQALGPDHQMVGVTRLGYAQLLERMSDVAGAAGQYEQALRLLDGTFRWPPTAARYSALLLEHGEPAAARSLMDRALALSDALGASGASRALVLEHYARVLRHGGDLEGARRFAQRALDIRERARLPLGLGASLVQMAELAVEAGDDQAARPLYERALAVHEGMMRDHPHTNRTRVQYAELLARLGDHTGALAYAFEAARGSLFLARLALRGLPERRALETAAVHRRSLELLLALVEDRSADRELVARVFDEVIRARALVLDEIGRRLRTADTPEASHARQELADARARLARIVIQGPAGARDDGFAERRAQAQADAERAEEVLARLSASFRASGVDEEVGLADVLRSVNRNTAVVAYVHYRGLPTGASSDASMRYGAFVVPAGGRPLVFLPLGEGRAIDRSVSAVRAELLREARAGGRAARINVTRYRAVAATLREQVWDSLADHLTGAADLFVVPDGALHLVSVAALPVGGNAYLVEQGPTIHYLAAERDLRRPPAANRAGEGLLAAGGPRFDETDVSRSPRAPALRPRGSVPVAAASATVSVGTPCLDFQAMRFDELPASAAEAETIASMWPADSSDGGDRRGALLLQGRAATEAAVKRNAPGRRVLHLATHGYFLAGPCDPAEPGEAGGPVSVAAANPLLMAGLAFAGANHRAAAGDADDDGILTAAEIAAMDLSGVEWAVLSACDTGLGSIHSGEGVLGLRRAFRVAGAATVIMSLWPVDDVSTREWMTRLYAARKDGESTAAAVRAAMRGQLAARRAAGSSTHPFFWAGFVAAGDWR